jgi:hypothetical protein
MYFPPFSFEESRESLFGISLRGRGWFPPHGQEICHRSPTRSPYLRPSGRQAAAASLRKNTSGLRRACACCEKETVRLRPCAIMCT